MFHSMKEEVCRCKGGQGTGLLLKDFFLILQTDDVPKKITKFKKIRNLQKSKKKPLKKTVVRFHSTLF